MEMCSDPVPDAAVGAEIEARKDGISQAMPTQTKGKSLWRHDTQNAVGASIDTRNPYTSISFWTGFVEKPQTNRETSENGCICLIWLRFCLILRIYNNLCFLKK